MIDAHEISTGNEEGQLQRAKTKSIMEILQGMSERRSSVMSPADLESKLLRDEKSKSLLSILHSMCERRSRTSPSQQRRLEMKR